MESPTNKTSLLVVALTWLVVTLPLAWGVYQSVVNSRPLFRVSSTPYAPGPVAKPWGNPMRESPDGAGSYKEAVRPGSL